MVKPVGKYLQKHVKEPPRAQLEDLRQEVVQEAFDAERFDLGVDEEAAVRLDHRRG